MSMLFALLCFLILAVGLYIEYIVCQTEKFSIIFVCNLIFNLIAEIFDGSLKEVFSSILNIFSFSFSVFMGSIVAYFVYNKTRSFKSFAIAYISLDLLVVFLLSLFLVFVQSLLLFNKILGIGILIAFLALLIFISILMYRKYAMLSKNKNEEVTYISAPIGCPSCGRGLESDMTSCPYCGYNFEKFTNMYKEAVMEKQKIV